MRRLNRREFLKSTGVAMLGSTSPFRWVKVAFGAEVPAPDFTFAYISDSHIQHLGGSKFVRNWDRGLIRTVQEANLLTPRPDFFIFGGDLAQLGTKEEIDHGLEIMSRLRGKVYYVMGEHDYYLDLGQYWESRLGPQYYSFDHKGVHFIVLNSILTYDDWTFKRWPTPMDRMRAMARLDNPEGSPFLVGGKQRAWLKKDLEGIAKNVPIVVCSHSPLQKIYKGWNFWTDDAEDVLALLRPFQKVTVVYGHVHQIQYNQIGNISLHAVMATAWPWPYPKSYAQASSQFPELTVPMNRADPFFERDATGWQFIHWKTGHVDVHYQLPNNEDRTIAFHPRTGRPEDIRYQDLSKRIRPQGHF